MDGIEELKVGQWIGTRIDRFVSTWIILFNDVVDVFREHSVCLKQIKTKYTCAKVRVLKSLEGRIRLPEFKCGISSYS